MIERIILKTVDIPSLPPVAMKVMNLIKDDFASLKALEEIISRDQGFATRLLRIANSPYYGRDRKIEDISQALLLIGFETLKSLVIAASLKDLNRQFGIFEQKLWEHSLGVALCSSLLAMVTRLATSDEALVCGLMHDVGKTVINNAMPELYIQIYEKMYKEKRTLIEIENEVLGFNHTTIGNLIAKKWKLPEKLEMIITYHHTYPYPDYEDQAFANICNLVRVADQICLNLAIGLKDPIETEIDYESVGMTEESLKELIGLFTIKFDKQKDFLLS
ncbi:MAG TPA: HDOD domain-containing protein [Thermodesulfovibrio thiophilus]|uniref:HDOD domain-containing protein n=1 Tax=Thermodesulfovibrio thiophilus TaxID=340095 RepID=UPI00146EE954|nr:HDOD domain-containing protein [Thermodesulfovibrio thiophilus]HHW20792.1 HDOD domain-containing protein [Thermodesulfovibrio thiophilus]HQD36635.1 HDOD domain-containing protein [Thermodesulfovibrio thiophilus]